MVVLLTAPSIPEMMRNEFHEKMLSLAADTQVARSPLGTLCYFGVIPNECEASQKQTLVLSFNGHHNTQNIRRPERG